MKVSNPGILQVRRYKKGTEAIGDLIYDYRTDLSKGCIMIDPFDMTRQKRITADSEFKDLLVPVFRKGKRVYPKVSIEEAKKNAQENLEWFHPGIKRFINPHQFPVGLEKSLYALKTDLILKSREIAE